jgi:haemagglutination activity domain
MTTCKDRNWHSDFLGVFSIIGVLAHVILCCENHASAQITPDVTLSNNSSRITPNVNIKGSAADRIDGGVIRGANLFHSFREFNVGESQRVYFANPTGISNILTRVTGSQWHFIWEQCTFRCSRFLCSEYGEFFCVWQWVGI